MKCNGIALPFTMLLPSSNFKYDETTKFIVIRMTEVGSQGLDWEYRNMT